MAIRSFEIEGLDELLRDLAEFTDDAMPALQDASSTAAGIVLARAQSLVPVRTGNLLVKLRRTKKKLKRGDTVTFSSVTFGKGAAYGVPLELGHRIVVRKKKVGKVEARPFLRPAADESRPLVEDILIAAMNRELDRLGGSK
jgi:HK97 gp10 family phage protein